MLLSHDFATFSSQYNIASLIFSWFALANLWLTFSLIIDLTANQFSLFGTAAVVSTDSGLEAHAHIYCRHIGLTWHSNGSILLSWLCKYDILSICQFSAV
jgi:hypothetical protein